MKTTYTRLMIVAGLAGALASAAGCGSSSSSPTDSGTGGSAGHGGSGGGAGGGTGGSDAGITHKVNYTFDSNTQGWVLNNFCEMANLGRFCPVDGGSGGSDGAVAVLDASVDAAVPVDASAADGGGSPSGAPTLEWDSTDGSPSPGSLKVTVTFTDYNQYVDAIINMTSAVNLTGRTLHAMVQLVSSDHPVPGGLQFHASSLPMYAYGGDATLTLGAAGVWKEIAFDPSVAATTSAATPPFDPSMIIQLGIQAFSGTTSTPAAMFPNKVVFLIDTVQDQ